jgi:hypothetical protein
MTSQWARSEVGGINLSITSEKACHGTDLSNTLMDGAAFTWTADYHCAVQSPC